MLDVANECERAGKRQCLSHEQMKGSLQEMLAQLRSIKEQAEQLRDRMDVEGEDGKDAAAAKLLQQATSYVDEKQKDIVAEQKELYKSLTSLSKVVDRSTVPSVESFCYPRVTLDKKNVCLAISDHFLRRKEQELGEIFVKEAGLEIDPSVPHVYEEMNEIVESLFAKNVEPAIKWVKSRKRERQVVQRTALEFGLHRLAYLSRLADGKCLEALEYARANFTEFASTQMSKIEVLMGCIVYANKLEDSPYASFFDPSAWVEVALMFTKDFLNVQQHPTESPLKSLVNVAGKTIVTLMKTTKILKDQKDWMDSEETPLVLDLGNDDNSNHSTFICPVIREVATEDNPPTMLPCRHVLCQETLLRMPCQTTPICDRSFGFKCPYCPSIASKKECRVIKFPTPSYASSVSSESIKPAEDEQDTSSS